MLQSPLCITTQWIHVQFPQGKNFSIPWLDVENLFNVVKEPLIPLLLLFLIAKADAETIRVIKLSLAWSSR